MDVLDAIRTRATAPRLLEPGPTASELEGILEAAMHAPDHGRLKPWRFVVIHGAARARFGASMARSLSVRVPGAAQELLAKEEAKAHRAPIIVAVAARIHEGAIPSIEQILAVGAAVQNMLLAAEGMGLASAWKTGAPAYDPEVKVALGFTADDHIVGFVYLGSKDRDPPRRAVTTAGCVARL